MWVFKGAVGVCCTAAPPCGYLQCNECSLRIIVQASCSCTGTAPICGCLRESVLMSVHHKNTLLVVHKF